MQYFAYRYCHLSMVRMLCIKVCKNCTSKITKQFYVSFQVTMTYYHVKDICLSVVYIALFVFYIFFYSYH